MTVLLLPVYPTRIPNSTKFCFVKCYAPYIMKIPWPKFRLARLNGTSIQNCASPFRLTGQHHVKQGGIILFSEQLPEWPAGDMALFNLSSVCVTRVMGDLFFLYKELHHFLFQVFQVAVQFVGIHAFTQLHTDFTHRVVLCCLSFL